MSGDDPARVPIPEELPSPTQQVTAHQDAYVAARDIHIHQPAAAPPPQPRRPIWGNVPNRNLGFTGREDLLQAVRDALVSGDRAVVQALHGMGGVGKTQIAIEYTHRHADDYEIVWWLNADNAALLSEQFAALATKLGCADPGTPLPLLRQALHEELRSRQSWLLIFDNAEDPEAIAEWLPGGRGHVLITSRSRTWDEIAVLVEVDVLARPESVEMLRARVHALSADDAAAVAEAVGDLPLAVAQATGYMAETGMPATEYTRLLQDRATELLDRGRPPSYLLSLTAVTETAFDQLQSQDAAAANLAAICAFLAPEPIPTNWFPNAAAQLPAALAEQAADLLAWRQLLSRLAHSALARIDPEGLVMHRLTQSILRGHLAPGESAVGKAMAQMVVVTNHPGDESLPVTWPDWARALPHVLALDPAVGDDGLRMAALDAVWYLIRRGERTAQDLARHLYDQWRDRLGPEDDYTIVAASSLALALRQWAGGSTEARELDEACLALYRKKLGDDHPNTLGAADDLANDLYWLGEYRLARELHEDTLARRRRLFGEDDRNTLTCACDLGVALRGLGEYRAARELDEDTLARRRRVLGEDHPDTLISAGGLANNFYALGEYGLARELHEDALVRRRRVLGDDHPLTLNSAGNLAGDLYMLGEYEAAREVYEDTLARRRRVLGEDHPDTQRSAEDLATVLRAMDEDSPEA